MEPRTHRTTATEPRTRQKRHFQGHFPLSVLGVLGVLGIKGSIYEKGG